MEWIYLLTFFWTQQFHHAEAQYIEPEQFIISSCSILRYLCDFPNNFWSKPEVCETKSIIKGYLKLFNRRMWFDALAIKDTGCPFVIEQV